MPLQQPSNRLGLLWSMYLLKVRSSTFTLPNGAVLPEFDRFALFARDEALARVGKNLARILAGIALEAIRGASA